jgi:Zn-finger nucleic acid-binding protein
MSERQGIEIDYCPACRGVWLDRGELDKIVERSTVAAPAAGRGPAPPVYEARHHGHDERRRHGTRRKSFLEELFD